MRRLLSRFHLAKLTSRKTGFGHIGIARRKSFSSNSVSSWWFPPAHQPLLTICPLLLSLLPPVQEFLLPHHSH